MLIRPLSQIEQAVTIINNAYPFSVVCVLKLHNGPSPDVLRSALDALQRINPLLRAVIMERKNRYWFELDMDVKPIPLQILNRETENDWYDSARQQLNLGFDHGTGPLLKVVYLIPADLGGNAEIILSLHHAITDAVSLQSLIGQLLTLAGGNDKITNTLPATPEVLPVSPLMSSILPPALKMPRLLFSLIPFIFRQFKDEIRYKKAAGNKLKDTIPTSSENDFLIVSFSEEETSALVKWSRNKTITLNSILISAMLLVIYHDKYARRKQLMRALHFANMRPYLRPPVDADNMGCFIALMRFTVSISKESDIAQIGTYIDEQYRKAAKRGEKFLFSLLSKMLVKKTLRAHNARLGSVALSYAGSIQLKEHYGKICLTGIHGFITNNCLGAELSGFGKIYQGRLSLDMNFLSAETNREKAVMLANEIRALLLQVIQE